MVNILPFSRYHKYYDDVLILLKTGLRISELCGLTIMDVDFIHEVVVIDHQLLKSKEQGYYIETPKTKSGTRQNVKILISTLGYKVLLPAPQATDDTIYLYCKGSGASAKGFVSAGGFTVLKDSIVSDHIVPSLETRGKTYYNLRNKLEVDGVISERKFVRNYEFSAPSAASAVILGHTSNGNMDWKTAGGVRLKDL